MGTTCAADVCVVQRPCVDARPSPRSPDPPLNPFSFGMPADVGFPCQGVADFMQPKLDVFIDGLLERGARGELDDESMRWLLALEEKKPTDGRRGRAHEMAGRGAAAATARGPAKEAAATSTAANSKA